MKFLQFFTACAFIYAVFSLLKQLKLNKRTRRLFNATFFLITWRSSSSKSAAVYKISSKSNDFSLRYGDISIFKMAAVRHLGIVSPPYETIHEVPVKCHVNLMHRSEDIAVWIFRMFGLKCLFRSPKLVFWGLSTPNCDYSSSRAPKGTSLRKFASFKLSTVKICWGVWQNVMGLRGWR